MAAVRTSLIESLYFRRNSRPRGVTPPAAEHLGQRPWWTNTWVRPAGAQVFAT